MAGDILDGFEQTQDPSDDILGGFEAPRIMPKAVGDSTSDPEAAAKAINLGKQTGVPASVVEADPEKAQSLLRTKQASEAIRANPAVANYVAGNPMAGKVSADDYGILQDISKKLDWAEAATGTIFEHTLQGIKQGFGPGPLGATDEDIQKHPILAGAFLPFILPLDLASRTVGAAIGGASALGAETARQAGMNEAWANRLERDLHIIGTGALVESGFKPTAPRELNTLAKAAAEDTARKAEGNLTTDEFLGTAEGLKSRKEVDDFIKLKDEPLRLTGPAETAIRNGEMPAPGVDPIIDEFHKGQQKLDSIRLEDTFNKVQESKTRERSPDMMAEYLGHVIGDQEIYLPADKVVELYDKAKKAPGAEDGLFGFSPGIKEQLAAAVETGGDIAIPLKDFLARTDPAIFTEVKDSIRFRKNGITGEEAKELKTEEPKPTDNFVIEPNSIGGIIKSKNDDAILGFRDTKDAIKVGMSSVSKKSRGQGLGVAMYEKLLELAGEKGKVLRSDFAVSDDAIRVYESLKKRGYEVTQDPGAYKHEGGLTASSSFGSVFEVKPKPKAPEKTASAKPSAEEAIVQAEKKSLYLHTAFENAKALNLTEPEFKRYSAKIEAIDRAATEKVAAAAEREAKKRLSPEWKKNEAEIETEVRADLRSRPDIAADNYLRTGELPTGETRPRVYLNRAAVESAVGDGRLKALTSSTGVHPDDIAPFLGFKTGAELVNSLDLLQYAREAGKETPKAYLDRVVKQEVEARMEEKYGSLEKAVADAAREAALDTKQTELFATELEALARADGKVPPFSREQLTDMAGRQFSELPIKDVSYEAFRRDTERGGRNAEKALLAGKFDEAFMWKQRQFLSFLMAKEAKGFIKELTKAEKSFDKIVKEDSIKSIDQEYFDHANKILTDLGYTDKQGQEPARTLPELIQSSEGQLAVAYWIAHPEKAMEYSKLTVEEFRDLNKTMTSIMHNGKQIRLVENVHGAADLDNVVFDIKSELDRFDLIKQPLNPSIGQRAKAVGRMVTAAHLLVERMLDYTDKFNSKGPVTSYLDRPLRDSYTKELILGEKVTKQLQALQKEVDPSINDFIDNRYIKDPITGEMMNLTRKNLRHLILHMGSESGIEKVTKGFGIDHISAWNLIRENAQPSDFRWAQGMWKTFNGLWEESSAMQRRYTGVEADAVSPRGIKMKLKDGTEVDVPGGYAPIFYDKTRSNIEGHIASKGSLFDSNYVPATTPQAYTLPRTKFAAPLDLTGTLMPSKIMGMVHDIAFREAVRNASKLINNAEFMQAMTQKWSKEYSGLLHGWLKDIANVHNVDDAYAMGATRFFSALRQNITSALIYLNPGTYIKHGGTAAGMSVAQTGLRDFAKATVDVGAKAVLENARALLKREKVEPLSQDFIDALKDVTDLGERGMSTREFILASSAVMRNRQRAYTDTIRGAYEQVDNAGLWQGAKDVRQLSMQIGRFPVALSDTMSAMPTWYAAYKKSFSEGASHADAVFEADRVVSRAHGSSFIGDKPRVSRTGEAMRWVTPLYNFWNHMANNMFQYAWDISATVKGREEPGAHIQSLTNRLFLYAILPIVVEELASPALDHDGRSLGSRALSATVRYFGSFLVGVRDITNAAFYGYEPSVGLVGTVGKSLTDIARDAKAAGFQKTVSKDWLTHMATALGMATGIGGTQVGKTATGVVGLETGRERPRSFNEYRQMLRTGHTKARVHQ